MRRLAPGDVDRARCAARRAADRMNERKVLFEQIVAHDRVPARAMPGREGKRCVFELLRPHVVGRRIDQVTGKADALYNAGQVVAVDTCGYFEAKLLGVGRAIAGEAIGAQREGEGAETGIVWRVGEAIAAFGQEI